MKEKQLWSTLRAPPVVPLLINIYFKSKYFPEKKKMRFNSQIEVLLLFFFAGLAAHKKSFEKSVFVYGGCVGNLNLKKAAKI